MKILNIKMIFCGSSGYSLCTTIIINLPTRSRESDYQTDQEKTRWEEPERTEHQYHIRHVCSLLLSTPSISSQHLFYLPLSIARDIWISSELFIFPFLRWIIFYSSVLSSVIDKTRNMQRFSCLCSSYRKYRSILL